VGSSYLTRKKVVTALAKQTELMDTRGKAPLNSAIIGASKARNLDTAAQKLKTTADCFKGK
jgi:hypothetical protein